MTKLTDSANTQSAPEVNGRPRPEPRVRTEGSLVAFTASAVALLLLLIFILQNGQRTDVHFFGAHGRLPMGVALLLAAVFGVLVVTIHATVRRIIHLRRPRWHRTTTIARPDSAGREPGADMPEGRNS